MGRVPAAVSRVGIDVLVVVGALSAVVSTVWRDTPGEPQGPRLWLEAVALALALLLLLGRHRYPFLAPVAVWVICPALSFVDGYLVPAPAGVFIVGLAAAMMLGNLRDDTTSLAGLAVVVVGAVVVVWNRPGHTASDLLSTPVLFAISWLVGHALRQRSEQTELAERRAEQAERDREVATRLAVAEERARIARELHDVVAHALSVMVLQVGALRRRSADGTEDHEALQNVEDTGRAALADMRRLLHAVRGEDVTPELGPQPSLDDLDRLLAEVRTTGLAVDLQVSGDRVPLPSVLELSAYRIVQEGLTNVMRHSTARRADVEVTYGAHDLTIEVSDDGEERSATPDGFGLVGIRERVHLLGGRMWSGAGARGYVLRAELPLEAEPS